jgi:surfeit locus 1 family protein
MKIAPRALIVLAVIIAAFFARLGFWQLSRLGERRALNAQLASRAVSPTVPIAGLPSDTAKAHYRRVSVDGSYDYSNEIVLTLRSRDGSPGVNIVTPLQRPGKDTAVLVVRGWVYAPDGMTVDLSRWRERSEAAGNGFVETYPPPRGGRNSSPTHPNAYRWLDRAELEKRFRYPLAPFYVVLTAGPDSESVSPSLPSPDSAITAPPRLSVPSMDEGPHKNYAIQWFSFAAISIIGMTLLLRRK